MKKKKKEVKKTMPRPKGSKNKPKEKVVTNGGNSMPESPVETVKKFVSSTGCLSCAHPQEKHYKSGEGKTDWCNWPGCQCLTYTK